MLSLTVHASYGRGLRALHSPHDVEIRGMLRVVAVCWEFGLHVSPGGVSGWPGRSEQKRVPQGGGCGFRDAGHTGRITDQENWRCGTERPSATRTDYQAMQPADGGDVA